MMWVVSYKNSFFEKSRQIWYDHKEEAVDHAKKLIRAGYWVKLTQDDKQKGGLVVMALIDVPIDSYDNFRSAVLARAAQGLGYDVDGSLGYQCQLGFSSRTMDEYA